MSGEINIAIAGDTVINRRISTCADERFLSLLKIIREADIAYTDLETVIHDYDGPEVYPAAEGGWTWMRSPRYIANELKWAGFHMVSHASNHALDYSYGGLMSTWQALDEAGIVHAGTGRNLGEAREPVYVETSRGRVALVTMCSSFAGWARAGDARRDVKGRPGLNPLRYYYMVDGDTLETVKGLAIKLGWWVTQVGRDWLLNPPGTHNTIYRFTEGTEQGVTTVADESDVDGNLRSIKEARRQADFVLVNLHNHEWDPGIGLSAPPKFVPPFAHTCIENGADIFMGGGSHSLMRGIEIYKGKPILYDIGDFIMMNNTVSRLPADCYQRQGNAAGARDWRATPADYFDARGSLLNPLNPPGGYFSAKVLGSVVAVCTLKDDGKLTQIKLYPFTQPSKPRSQSGIPRLALGEKSEKIIRYLAELSLPFGTRIDFKEGIGIINTGI